MDISSRHFQTEFWNELGSFNNSMYTQFRNLMLQNLQMVIYFLISTITYLFIIFKIKININFDIFNKIYIFMYDYFFGNEKFKLSTPNLYNYSINKLKNNSKVLDFGCGNGICYKNDNVIDTIKNKNLQIVGIDIDEVYVKQCSERIINSNLEKNVTIKLMNIFNYQLENNEDKFDYVIFSESAPLLSNELLVNIIKYIDNNLIKKDGKIIFINNLTDESSPMKIYKPYLKYISLIDFGRLLSDQEFFDIGKNMNKNVIINLIDSMKFREVLSFFNLNYLYYIARLFGITDYNIEQYEIIFSNKNNI
jgi:SAM-dependent methyltransferase